MNRAIFRRVLLPGLFLVLAAGPVVADNDAAQVAQQAHAILKANCYRCHGQDGAVEGGFNYILDRDKLVARKKIVLGKADQSPLFLKLAGNKMPPPDEQPRPSAADVDVLKKWIDAGAPGIGGSNVARSFVTDADVHAWMLADLEPMEKRSRRFVRYFSLVHLYNAGLGEDELQTYRHALAKLINSLSWHPRITVPQPIDARQLVLRIDLREFMWDANLWNRILAEYPYGVLQDTALARAVSVATATKLPVVRADWFIATACRPPLYQELLQLPANVAELERQLRVDVAVNLIQERVARAGFNGSGVSRNNRILERHDAIHGAYWRTYDFEEVPQNLVERDLLLPDRRNVFAYPLGPAGFNDLSFQHAGGEVIFNLPNGLQAYMLLNANGIRIDKANTAIVSDPKRPDRAVETGISCMSCHYRGMNFKDDQVRDFLDKNPQAFARGAAELIRALYVPRDKMKKLMEEDAERFAKAVAKTGARISAFEPIATMTVRYEGDVDLPTAAAEVGVAPEELLSRIGRTEQLTRNLGALKAPGGTVARQVFLQSFADIVRELRLGVALQPGLIAQTLPDNTGEIDPLEGISSAANRIAFSPDGRFALFASADKSVRLYDVEAGRDLRRFVGHTASVWAVAFSADGRRALSGGADKTVRLWDVETGREIRRFDGHDNLVTTVSLSPDGRRALSAGYDHWIILWDLETGQAVRTYNDLGRYINHVAYAADGRRALVCADKSIQVFEAETGKKLARLDGHTSPVETAAFSADGRSILSGSDDHTVRLWDAASGKQSKIFVGHAAPVKAVAFGANGSRVLSGSADWTVRLWDVAGAKELRQFGKHAETVLSVALLPGDAATLSGSRDSTVLTWTLAKVSTPVGPTPPTRTEVSPAPTPAELRPTAVIPGTGTVASLLLSPDRKYLYYLNIADCKAVRIDLATRKQDREVRLADGTETLVLTPDGKTLFAAAAVPGKADGKLQVIDPQTFKIRGSYAVPTVPYDLAAGDNLVFISGARGDWSDIIVLDVKREEIVARWGGIWNRSLLRLSPKQDRLYVSTQGVSPGQVDGLVIPAKLDDKPVQYTSPERGKQPLGGQFVLTPDGRFLLCKTGPVLQLSPNPIDDMRHVTTLEPFLTATVDAEGQALFLTTADGSLKQLSYPDFKPERTWRLGGVGYQAVLDSKQTRLYVAVFDPKTLTDRPTGRGSGNFHVYDLGK